MNYSETLNLAAKVRELKDSISQANILDAVYVNENVHSRILRLIMDYKRDGHYPFYELFLELNKVSTIIPDDISCSEPHFFNERDRIDLLIEGNDYAIIIENKIYNAIDQDHQMERYLLSCIGRGFKKERIFALYLTSDGTKNISKNSLTDKALEVLGFSDQTTGRFAEISFRYDILPWLRKAINICRTNDDEQIKSALIQYADYLAGMFGEREKESKKDLAITQLLAEYEVNSVSAFCDCISVIYNLSEELNQRRDSLCRDIAIRFIINPIREYCTDQGIEFTFEGYSFGFLRIRMSLPEISKASFCFNTEGDGRNIYGICNRDAQDGEVLQDRVQKHLAEAGFRKSLWWPAYRYPNIENRKFSRTGSADFWEVCVPDDFTQYVIATYEEVKGILRQDSIPGNDSSALIQYVDSLDGMSGEREKETEKELAITQLLAEHEINSVSAFCDCISAIDNLSEELNQRRDIYCQSLAMTYVSKPLREYCTDQGIELTYEFYSFSFLSIRMSLPGISKASFRFNTEGDGRNIYGICNYDAQDGEVLQDRVQKHLAEARFRKSLWWPAYRYPKDNPKFLRTGSLDFWEVCVPDDFTQYVIATYKEVSGFLDYSKF